jgi:hypothetical protein
MPEPQYYYMDKPVESMTHDELVRAVINLGYIIISQHKSFQETCDILGGDADEVKHKRTRKEVAIRISLLITIAALLLAVVIMYILLVKLT